MKIGNREKALRALRYAGQDGIHSFKMTRIAGLRCAARIEELRKQGHNIISKHEKMGDAYGVRYVLEE